MAIINGTYARNVLQGSVAGDRISGLDGDDTLFGLGGNDTIYGGDPTDPLGTWDRQGEDFLYGGDGDDRLYGGDEADFLDGGAGNDLLDGGLGMNTLAGGEGADTFAFRVYEERSYPSDQYLVLDFTPGEDILDVAAFGISSFATVKTLATQGEEGWTSIAVRAAYGDFEMVLVGIGTDQLSAANFRFSGSTLASAQIGTEEDDDLFAGRGNDTLSGNDGADRLFGEEGDDVLAGYLLGSSGQSYDGDNTLYGGAGGDSLLGSGGGDRLYGGVGNDTLVGGEGKDTLTGGSGADRFAYDAAEEYFSLWSADLIIDFRRGEGDKIDLSRIDANPLQAGNQAFVFAGRSADPAEGRVSFWTAGSMVFLKANVDDYDSTGVLIAVRGVTAILASDLIL